MRVFREHGNPEFTLSAEVHAVLQLCTINEPLFPNLQSLELWSAVGEFIPFIPSFLSQRTTSINITFTEYNPPKVVLVASMLTAFPTLCPDLQTIRLRSLPGDPIITVAASKLLLTINQNTLRQFHVDSPLTEEAREVIYKLSNLYGLTVVVEGSASLPTMMFPNLIDIDVKYNHNCDWLEGFRGATLGKLNSVTFHAKSESAQLAGFLEAFESAGLATSTTLSSFSFCTLHPWRPNYRSLLPFKQLRELRIEFCCEDGCSSTIDDDIITDMARAMPKLETLQLGIEPCGTPAGVTVKGLAALARHCPDLSSLNIHFRVDSFNVLPAIAGTPHTRTAVPRRDCALTDLAVGQTPMLEESALMVALTLVRIFPNIMQIDYTSEDWGQVSDAIKLSRRLIDHTSKDSSLAASRSNSSDTFLGAALESDG
jgi:hypothetical protein